MDIDCNDEEIYAIGWCLATVANYDFMSGKGSNNDEELELKLLLIQDAKMFSHLQDKKYNDTLELIQSLTNA